MGVRIATWNVNGIRACVKHGFFDWFDREQFDVVCLQETKAREEQLDPGVIAPMGYQSYWHSAEKAGYSGVAVYTKTEPLGVHYGLGVPEIDREGRVLTLEFADFQVISAYFPNSGRDHSRLDYKLDFCRAMLAYCQDLQKRGKHFVLCGDYNIAHREIDLKNPKSNHKTAGFLPAERAWMDQFTEAGFVDCFRQFEPGPDHYTWWSYRPGVRARNIGWRIDYQCVNPELADRVLETTHQPEILGSDHCPVVLTIKV